MEKPYQQVPILECHEPLVPIPLEKFAVVSPHPYQQLGAVYGDRSPYYLRQSVVSALLTAQTQLQKQYPCWRILIFDAYRPVAVQQFMVDYTFNQVVQTAGLQVSNLSATQRQEIWEQVYQLWAVPSSDKRYPPPHSTGGAVDVTLVNSMGENVDMGSAIDELSERSHPDYYATSTCAEAQQYHHHRQILFEVMHFAGFQRHPGEWWHFSLGDQIWAYLVNQAYPHNPVVARYGRIS
ncbi:M15 family metallopeptidase [Gloeocapsopsis dulcis]|uniref:D-alanyl-D-alanine dipeptidase n=1 Tax=Gloeocapsopsis dulcis AAB1 = 1H9 TaxID=1433147 RepID=A0A6N8FZ76_9CHRO|nr:M15 family metallopeptidase [Gloeocapsopsis dulcis]MUL38159.1 D-alanyl-D-alanine dipeptidase [Gloeocapsopsis dulcis AAB1 = 1H9]WNN90808.1 M15 family metallopeptidase [Gloeocapsopsis dulcis]